MLSKIAGLLLSASSAMFTPPVSYDVSLAGNFGEPRPNHFHGGIDVKTAGVEGKPIYSIGDGYVSRVTVGLYGFGNAVYVTHPEGVTSVYCHLKSFSSRIERLLKRWQYENETYQADMSLSPIECPVAQGQLIAISGNTGYSMAPHLHLEIHDTRSWDMLNPLDFLSSYISDRLPPRAHGLMACPVQGRGTFNGGSGRQNFGFTSHCLDRQFTAWGKVGFAIWANDYSETAYNSYGVKETVLTVDGREVFHSDVTDIPMRCNRMVNSWGDYDYYFRTGVWYMKSFVEPGISLPVVWADENRGLVDFCEERDYHLEYILRDFHGNTSTYSFVVKGKKCSIPSIATVRRYGHGVMRWNRANLLSRPGMQLVIPAGMLSDDVELYPSVINKPDRLSSAYTFTDRPLPLLGWGELSIAVHGMVKHPEKLYIVGHYGVERFMGGTYKDGWVTGRICELGTRYELEYDDIPPVITPIGQDKWEDGQIIRFALTDDRSGVKSYRGYIDGRFVLFKGNEKSAMVICRLKDTPIEKTGKRRHLKLVVIDNCENKASFETALMY